MKRTSIGSGSCQRAANPSKVRKQNPIKNQRSKPGEVSKELKQEKKESHKASLNDRRRPHCGCAEKGEALQSSPWAWSNLTGSESELYV